MSLYFRLLKSTYFYFVAKVMSYDSYVYSVTHSKSSNKSLFKSKTSNCPLARRIHFLDRAGRSCWLDVIIDSGAAASVIVASTIVDPKIEELESKPSLTGAFGAQPFEILGKITLFVILDGVKRPVEFIAISEGSFDVLLGWPDILRLKLSITPSGVLTKEGRVLGRPSQNQVMPMTHEDSDVRLYNIVSHDVDNKVLRIGDAVIAAVSGTIEVAKHENRPVFEEFNPKDLITVPTQQPKPSQRIDSEIDKLFAKNQFKIDVSIDQNTRTRIKNLMIKYQKCLSLNKNEIGAIPSWKREFKQEFTVDRPLPCPLYRINPVKARFICKELDKLEAMKVIKRGSFDVITTSMLAVPKSDGNMRMVCDMRFLNRMTRPANLHLSRLDDISRNLMGNKYYFSFDIQKAFWNISIPESQQHWYTVQCSHCGKRYSWLRMTMGSRNSSAIFQSCITELIVSDLAGKVNCYIDDLSAGFNSIEEGLMILEKLLERVCRYNIKLGVSKICLFTRQLEAFGIIHSQEGLRPNDDRILALKKAPLPTNKKELLSSLASFNYYRAFIPNFAARAHKLWAITGAKATYDQSIVDSNWPDLKNSLAEAVKLAVPNYDFPFILSNDASVGGIGVMLSQEIDGQRRIIGVHSQGLSKSEKLWSISSKELKAIYVGLSHFEHLIIHHRVKIECDNLSVFYLLKLRLDQVEISARLPAIRHLLYISTFQYEIVHVSGKEPSFLLADYLSRAGYSDLDVEKDEPRFALGRTSKEPLLGFRLLKSGKLDSIPVNQISSEIETPVHLNHPPEPGRVECHRLIKLAQIESSFCRKIVESPEKYPQYLVEESVVYRPTSRGKFIVCPRHYSTTLVKFIHKSDHNSARKMIAKLNYFGIWLFKKYQVVVAVTQSCDVCDPARSQKCFQASSKSICRPHHPFDIVNVDLMQVGDIPILVLVDALTGFICVRVLKQGTSVEIRAALMDIFCHFGLATTVVVDNAVNLNSEIMKQFYDTFNIQVSNSSPYHSPANGRAESCIRLIQDRTRIWGLDLKNLSLNMQIICHRLNLEKRGKYSAFEKLFARSTSWALMIPDLTKTKAQTLDKSLKMLFDSAAGIRAEIFDVIEKRRNKIKNEILNTSVKLKKGDQVRVKDFMKKGSHKKLFQPFMKSKWLVVSVRPFTNTVLLKEITEPEFQPRFIRRHVRFLRRVNPIPKNLDDDLDLGYGEAEIKEPKLKDHKNDENSEIKNDVNGKGDFEQESDINHSPKSIPEKIAKSTKVQPKTKTNVATKSRSRNPKSIIKHRMTLRTRKQS